MRNYIIYLQDGKNFTSLRRHISASCNMTPKRYRAKWKPPSDHPIVAPSYSATRSQLAREAGLGQIAATKAARTVTSDGAETGRSRKAA